MATKHPALARQPAPAPAHEPVNQVSEISRRSFLKLLSLSLAGTLIEPASAGALASAAPALLSAGQTASEGQIPPAALALLRQAFQELSPQGFAFELDHASVVANAKQPQLIGLLLHDRLLAPRQIGANIALTINTSTPERSALQIVVGQSRADGLLVVRSLLAPGAKRHDQRSQFARGSTMISDEALFRPAPLLVAQDVPPARAGASWVEHTRWSYAHSDHAVWASDGTGSAQLIYTTCQEYRHTRERNVANATRLPSWKRELHQITLR